MIQGSRFFFFSSKGQKSMRPHFWRKENFQFSPLATYEPLNENCSVCSQSFHHLLNLILHILTWFIVDIRDRTYTSQAQKAFIDSWVVQIRFSSSIQELIFLDWQIWFLNTWKALFITYSSPFKPCVILIFVGCFITQNLTNPRNQESQIHTLVLLILIPAFQEPYLSPKHL